ncbi:heparinase II/III family protein [Streptomyces sp. NPDC006624]|uniref:heparinase II/III domain-containing protein n=1 Tax=unclassified Streptomyces TaxID=2593676 RepID=UPI0033BAC049
MADLVRVIAERAARWVRNPTLTVPGELPEWWHVAWERLGDVAFAHALQPSPAAAGWLRAETLRLCALPVDAWVGPSFRPRLDPPIGMLETAHVGLGVAEVLELAPEIFTPDERSVVTDALVDHCLLPCERALLGMERGADQYAVSGGEEGTPLNNWYMVLLDAFGAVSLLIGDTDRTATLTERCARATALYNSDSYGESLQYFGYASLHHSNLRELLLAYGQTPLPDLAVPYAAMMPWLAHSTMFQGPNAELGPGTYTTMVNFGDSALTARPPADLLTGIARRDGGAQPADAALARWLFDHTYSDLQLEPSGLSTFGFFSQIGWRSVVNLSDPVAPRAPHELSLPVAQSFETGTVAVRDRWEDTRTVLAAQAGNTALNVDGHRHDDHGSFVLSHGDELFFTDPGHCSYRLRAQQEAKQAAQHSTWVITDPVTGATIERSHVHGAPVGDRSGPEHRAGCTVFGVDLADRYPATVIRARRTWIALLPHIVLVVDDIAATEPVTIDTRFLLNDRDRALRLNQATDQRLVLRRGAAAAKFFLLRAEDDGGRVSPAFQRSWTAVHDIYQPQPNAPTQGREGSGVVYSLVTPQPTTRHRAVYSIVLDADREIRGWHVSITESGIVDIERPDGTRTQIDTRPVAARGRAGNRGPLSRSTG